MVEVEVEVEVEVVVVEEVVEEEEVGAAEAEEELLEVAIHNNLVVVAFQEVVAESLEVEREDFDKSPVDEEEEVEEGGGMREMREEKEV